MTRREKSAQLCTEGREFSNVVTVLGYSLPDPAQRQGRGGGRGRGRDPEGECADVCRGRTHPPIHSAGIGAEPVLLHVVKIVRNSALTVLASWELCLLIKNM